MNIQKEHVTNADKLLELEYIWSVTPYAITQGIDVYQINSYSDNAAAVLFKGGSADACLFVDSGDGDRTQRLCFQNLIQAGGYFRCGCAGALVVFYVIHFLPLLYYLL